MPFNNDATFFAYVLRSSLLQPFSNQWNFNEHFFMCETNLQTEQIFAICSLNRFRLWLSQDVYFFLVKCEFIISSNRRGGQMHWPSIYVDLRHHLQQTSWHSYACMCCAQHPQNMKCIINIIQQISNCRKYKWFWWNRNVVFYPYTSRPTFDV